MTKKMLIAVAGARLMTKLDANGTIFYSRDSQAFGVYRIS